MKQNRSPRDVMGQRLMDMVELSSPYQVDGRVYIVYERVGDLQWLPGKGDGESMRWSKHWRLIIQLGFDCFSLEFLENSLVSRQGVLLAEACDINSLQQNGTTLYLVGDLKSLSTDVLFAWILEEFHAWSEYNLLQRNCQHFVYHFLSFFERSNYLVNRTDHLRSTQQHELEKKSSISSSMSNWDPVTSTLGHVVGCLGFKSKTLFKSISMI